MSTSFPTKAVANTLLAICREKGYSPISPMKLQKLVYFAHGWHLAYTGKPLIGEEIQAWDYGPVIDTLYRDLKGYGSGDVTGQIPEIEYLDQKFTTTNPLVESPEIRTFLGNVVDVYGPLSAIQLSNMTHQPDTPWAKLKAEFPTQRALTIPDELIEDHFAAKLPNKV